MQPQQPIDPNSKTVALTSPADWPGAFKIYKVSKAAVKSNLGTILSLIALSIAVSFILEIIFGDKSESGSTNFRFSVGDPISVIISALLTIAMVFAYIASVRGNRVTAGETISKSISLWLPAIGLTILTALIYVLSLLLLIVPFFFVFPRLVLAYYFMADQKLGIIESIKASWAATAGNVGKVYGIVGANFAMALLMITFIGIPFAIYFLIMYSAAFAVLYEYIRKNKLPITDPDFTQSSQSSPAQTPPAS